MFKSFGCVKVYFADYSFSVATFASIVSVSVSVCKLFDRKEFSTDFVFGFNKFKELFKMEHCEFQVEIKSVSNFNLIKS